MVRILCHVGVTDPSLSVPEPFTLNELGPTYFFKEGSSEYRANAAINLRFNFDRLRSAAVTGVESSTYSLYKALDQLLPIRGNAQGTTHIGLIYARRWEVKPTVLGLMFDSQFIPLSASQRTVVEAGAPREGCAVFLDAIYDLRKGLGVEAVRKEAMFTTIHELGHVFNLWHMEDSPSFLASSRIDGLFSNGNAYGFRANQRRFLSQCDGPLGHYVLPTGSEFDERGALERHYGMEYRNEPRRALGARSPLELSLHLPVTEFWHFEPIELEVRISLRSGRSRSVSIPDVVDPGYAEFALFITAPNGERRLYRPVKRFCTNSTSIKIDVDQPFCRDIGIYGQSGSFTFGSPGVYEIEARLALPNGSVLYSKSVTCEVRSILDLPPGLSGMATALCNHRMAKALYYRRGDRLAGSHLNEVKELLGKKNVVRRNAYPLYALSRLMLNVALARRDRALLSSARRTLSMCSQQEALGEHARLCASTQLTRDE